MNRPLVTRWFRRWLPALCLWTAAASYALPLRSQPIEFGSADDPREQLQQVWWRYQSTIDARGGLSLISDQWRAAGAFSMNVVTRPFTARLQGALRGGPLGTYRPDVDEAYDVLRLVDFVRPNLPQGGPLYVRGGVLDRVRLGTGHLVNFFNSKVAWDDRTVGAEGTWQSRYLGLQAFTDDVLLDGVVGARLALRPFRWERDPRTQSFELGFTMVSDRNLRNAPLGAVTGYDADLSFDVLRSGEVRLAPFASYAWYPAFGSGLSLGADLTSDNFIDLARFRFRIALYYNGKGFIPGYFGSFYQVSNPRARILNASKYLVGDPEVSFEGVTLANARGGDDLEVELRLLFFERFELWYYFRRHYGSQSLGEHHLRLFVQARNRFSVDVGIDRGGLAGFLSLFNTLGDQSALHFQLNYRVAGPFWAFIQSRYTFEQVGTGPDGIDRYLVQRRFEPYMGIRLSL